MKKICLLIIISVSISACSQDGATIKEETRTFTTYPFSDPDAIPRPERNYYPYFRFDGFSTEPESVEWKVIVMENKYVKVNILPEIGGKIWGAIEKSTGNEFVYYNNVVKFRDIAMRGPWTSGGIEFNFGVIGHTPAVSTPVDYIVKTNDDGSVSCFIGAIDLLTRTRWEIEINLPGDKAYFTTNVNWYNSTPNLQPYYHWSNAAYQADGDLEMIFPGSHSIGHDGNTDTWPVDKNGRKVSFYRNNDFGGNKSRHIVGDVGDFFAAYWHNLDFGAGHYSLYSKKLGKKVWLWSHSRSGAIWEDLLTDTDGQYVELQSGRLFNQASTRSTLTPFKHFGFMPYSTDIMKEYWYPVMDIGGVAKANYLGALNLEKEDDKLKIRISPLQAIRDEINIYFGNELTHSFKINVKTLEKWEKVITGIPENKPVKIELGDSRLVYSEERDSLTRPLETPSEFNWGSVYGFYLDGLNWVYQNRFDTAYDSFKACLEKDPFYAPALNQIAELYYRRGDFDNSLNHVKKSLALNTYDPRANFVFGLVSKKKKNLIDAQDGFSVASLTPSYRSAAYIELAKLFICKNDLYHAEKYAGKVFNQDAFNQDAILLLAVIARKNGYPEEARKYLDILEGLSPLNHFVRFEKMLLKDNKQTKNKFLSLIRNELPHETFTEMALWYEYIGYTDEAIKLLELSPKNSLIYLMLAYFNQHDSFQTSDNYLNKAIAQPPDFIFPFRIETVPVLEWAISNTDDWKPKYYLGLLHWSLGNRYYAKDLFSQCSRVPDSPYFYLAKSIIFQDEINYDAENDLLKARMLGKNDWRTSLALIDYYLEKNKPDEALSIAEEAFNQFPSNSAIQYNYAKCLLANKLYTESLNNLENAVILPYEGASYGRVTYRQAALMEGLKYLNEKRFDQAMNSVDKARLWPENLGVGRPYSVDERIEDFLQAKLFFNLNESEKALDIYNNILGFTEERESVYSSTDFLYLTVLKRLGRNEKADVFLSNWQQDAPDDPVLRWTMAMINNDRAAAQLIEEEIETEAGGTPWDPRYADTEFELVKAISSFLKMDSY